MAQQIINTGAAANDGTGDPLRTAFTETNDNFTEIYTAGPVGSNVQIVNNTILTLNTNGNLVLAPNGTGRVVANVDVVPNRANVRNLGSATARWSTVYAQYLNVTNSTTVAGDMTVGGNLTVTGDIIEVGNIITDALTIQLANTAGNSGSANGAGVTVGASDDIATLLYNSTGNVWTTNIGISAVGNITAPYFVGNGSLLTGITNYGNSNVSAFLAAYGNNTISTTGNITGGYIFGNGSQLTGLPESYGNANVTALLSNLGSNVISGTGNITTTGKVIAGNLNSPTLNNSGNISVVASGNTWTFSIDGNLTVPGNIQTISTGFPFSSNISGINTGSPTVMVTLTDAVFGAPEIGQVTISGVVGTTQANDTWYYASIDPSNFVLYNDAAATNPVNGNTWTAYISGGSAVSQGYSNISITGGNVSVATGTGDTWLFGANGNLTLPLGGQIIVSGGLISSGASPAPSINGFGSINSITVSASGNITGGNIVSNTMVSNGSGNITVTGNLIPSDGYFLGLPGNPWANAYFGPDSITILDEAGNIANAVIISNELGNTIISAGGFIVKGNGVPIFQVEALTGQIFSNAQTIIENATDAANVTSGSLQTAGGAGIAKNLYVGNNIVATGNITGNYIIGDGSQLTNISGTIANVVANVITFNTSAGISVDNGQMAWNSADGTVDIGLGYDDVVLQVGQETHYVVRNATGNTILNGTSVYCSGVTAGSGRMEATPYTANGTISPVQYLGLATMNIANGVNGVITYFGYVRGLDTRGTANTAISVGDETWAEGDKLYAHPTAAGKLTKVEPTAPNDKICVCVVITRHQNTGVLFVRPTTNLDITDHSDVQITTPAANNFLTYTGNRWENTALDISVDTTPTLGGSLAAAGFDIGNVGNITTTGNITAGNFIGNGAALTNVTVSIAGNIVGTQPNVSLVAGSYTSTFDNTGNVSMPGNVFANGVNVRQIETIAVNSVAANAAYTGTTVDNWTTSYTGSGGKIKIQAQISAFTNSGAGAYTWALQRNSANVATGRFYFNQTNVHMTVPTIAYIDSSGNTAPQTYSILLGNNMICDSGDTCLIMITEY